jgi:hypothetical protein
MKLSPILITALLALSVGPLLADSTDTTTKPAPAASATPATPTAAPASTVKSDTDIVYPYTFTCVHCGMKITVKNAAEWKKTCEMCACGTSNAECMPKKKK